MNNKEYFPCRITRYGFQWGAANVIRCTSDPKWGVMFNVETPKQRLQLRVTPKGKIVVEKHYKTNPCPVTF